MKSYSIDIDSMPAGKEMDALIIKKIMEWTETDVIVWESSQDRNFEPSTSIMAAWEIVKKIDCFSLEKDFDEADWICTYDHIPSFAATAPLAICRAALKAVGGK